MQRFMCLIVGVIFLAVGVFMFVRNNRLEKNCTAEAQATVVDMKEEVNTDSDAATNYTYYPIVEYTAGETAVRAVMDDGSSTPAYDIGEKVTILYNPNKINEFMVKGAISSKIISYVLMALGALISIFGVKVALTKEPKVGAKENVG